MSLNKMGPDCPSCGAWITKVVVTKLDDECGHIVRRRHCEFCDHRFYTRQALEELVDVKWVPGSRPNRTIPKIVKVYQTQQKPKRVA